MRYCYPAFFLRVLELAVTTFLVALNPTLTLKYFYYFSTFYTLTIHTMCIGVKGTGFVLKTHPKYDDPRIEYQEWFVRILRHENR